ncbi:helix-turn-helix domain-containing protein [Actinacidiphila oryziradicis]|uniref:Helix-turn-helix transcriptional regulator n=1 Tax=Actinacidiphila oryziradicis TaxID=2571141 RepID=A0A4U0SVP8_9ACTN|nr:helix-turn-helix transcriptional regulator [Actinacidiphila oryziradicis]TKA12167.1 helix-turn-helix transcriptional regulator [Actinacidiphila oryziradicis]
MPPRSTPTARQQRLGAELRKLREQSGMSTQQAAALLGVNRTRIPNIEAGRFPISADRVRTLACNYGCPDSELVDLLTAMAQERETGWWEQYRGLLPAGLLDLAELEHHSTQLVVAVTAHLPGLFQTEDHARALHAQADPPLPEQDFEARVELRLSRQAIFERATPTPITAVIHEAALRMQFGGRKVARAQLEHIVSQSERDNTTVRVIPFEAGAFPGAGQSITYAAAAVTQLDTVQLDSAHGILFIDADMQIRRYRGLLDRMGRLALAPEKSRDFIRAVAQQL